MITATIRIGLVLPDPVLRAGAAGALHEAGHSVAEASTLVGLANTSTDAELDVLVVDERLLPVGGVAGTAVIALTDRPTVAGLIEAYQRGATGYLGSDVPTDALLAAVEDVAHGISVAPPALTAMLIGSVFERRPGSDGRAAATPRQSQITVLLDEGLTTNEIADLLGISPVTVRRHRSELVARRRRQSYNLAAAGEDARAC